MDFTYDKEVNAMYVKFTDNKIVETLVLGNNVYMDIDADDKPVGIEYLLVNDLPPNTLKALLNA